MKSPYETLSLGEPLSVLPYVPNWTAAQRALGVSRPVVTPVYLSLLKVLRQFMGCTVPIREFESLGITENTLRIYVGRIRKHLAGSRLWIETRKEGYALVVLPQLPEVA